MLMFSAVPSAVRRWMALVRGRGRASRIRWPTMRRMVACTAGTTTEGASAEAAPPMAITRRSGAGRKAGGSWARRRSSTAAARGSSGRITRSTKARVKSSPFGSCSRSESIFAGPGTGRAAAASTQERTCAETSSRVGTAGAASCGGCAAFTGDNGVFSSFRGHGDGAVEAGDRRVGGTGAPTSRSYVLAHLVGATGRGRTWRLCDRSGTEVGRAGGTARSDPRRGATRLWHDAGHTTDDAGGSDEEVHFRGRTRDRLRDRLADGSRAVRVPRAHGAPGRR